MANILSILDTNDLTNELKTFTQENLMDLGLNEEELINIRRAQYFVITGDQEEPAPGVYKIKLATNYNIFAYKIMDLDLED